MPTRAGDFDYVIVGAGSSGCVVASRLAEDATARVLLVEAGGSDRNRFCKVPGMIAIVHTVPQIKKRFDWSYYTVPQEHAAGRRIPATRGKVLGGSSAINGMLFVRGHAKNYDGWAADGCPGWGFTDVLPAFKKLEDWEGGASEVRGAGGPIAVSTQQGVTEVSRALVEGIARSCDAPVLEDYNAPEQHGVGIAQMSARGGLRYSASEAYVHRRKAPNLTMLSGVTVSRVVFEGRRAVGIEVVEPGREPRVVRASKEVILAGGVFGSAQILMLSGIGPASHLEQHGIDVVADLPVGDNLHDHLFVPMTFLAPSAKHRGTPWHFFGGMLAESLRGGTWFGRTVFEVAAFVRSRFANGLPDFQILSLPWAYPSPNQDAPVRHEVDTRPAITLMATMVYPKSRGTFRLASKDPAASPLIDPAYLAEGDDVRFLMEAVRRTREIMASEPLAGVVTGELHPGPDFLDEAALARELPVRVHSAYHPVGTCRMGTDERAVVDPWLRVRGVDGLRVADASIMPNVIGGNTNAPCMMIGERCAEMVRAS